MFDFKGKTAVVTGGAQGIGLGLCEGFANAGASVAYIDADAEAIAERDADFTEKGYSFLSFKGDVGEEGDVLKFLEAVQKKYGSADFLINNAAIAKAVFDGSVVEFTRILKVNLIGTYICSHVFAPRLNEGGSIVNICSTRALMSEPGTEAYSASKGGILALTHALAVSLGPRLRVNAVSPGWIDVSEYQKASRRKPVVLTEADKAQHPAGRVGVPGDIAGMCLYLCSDMASFITGQNFVVDGGMTKKMIYV
jgi:NAD(P)-dependent dehydrogenase (short-subunit alcohol dehydrogenase family)